MFLFFLNSCGTHATVVGRATVVVVATTVVATVVTSVVVVVGFEAELVASFLVGRLVDVPLGVVAVDLAVAPQAAVAVGSVVVAGVGVAAIPEVDRFGLQENTGRELAHCRLKGAG